MLMGLPLVVSDDFEFDELNISAVCEIMNQMMGASSTALAELINTPIDISTPEANISKGEKNILEIQGINNDDYVCSVSFKLTIDGVIESEFITILTLDLAREMSERMLKGYTDALDTYTDANSPGIVKDSPAKEPEKNVPNIQTPAENYYSQPSPQPQYTAPVQQNNYPAEYYNEPRFQNVNVKGAQFPSFDAKPNYNIYSTLNHEQSDNLQLLMNVPLHVAIEIGSAEKKVKDILDFTKGTIIELEKQAGSPVDVVVNGNLIARGDVVVIDDNFAVRITEIVKSKFLDTLGNKEK
jgi:flagellar motor switch protein FliN/FliY